MDLHHIMVDLHHKMLWHFRKFVEVNAIQSSIQSSFSMLVVVFNAIQSSVSRSFKELFKVDLPSQIWVFLLRWKANLWIFFIKVLNLALYTARFGSFF